MLSHNVYIVITVLQNKTGLSTEKQVPTFGNFMFFSTVHCDIIMQHKPKKNTLFKLIL
jgi:hypothetical protein